MTSTFHKKSNQASAAVIIPETKQTSSLKYRKEAGNKQY
jgi:hypothetical protein